MDLSTLVRRIESLQPGQQIDIPMLEVMPANPAAAMELVIGSAYAYSYQIDDRTDVVRFKRRWEPLCPLREGHLRTFVDRDRLHLYRQRPDGLYEWRQN